jgi:hypothetical protein
MEEYKIIVYQNWQQPTSGAIATRHTRFRLYLPPDCWQDTGSIGPKGCTKFNLRK